MFYIWTTPANLKIQLKPSMSEIRNYLVANPIYKTDTLVSRRSESRAPGGEVWCMTVLLLEITRVVSARVRVCNYKRPRSSFVGSPCPVLPSCYPGRVIEEISTRGFLIRSYRGYSPPVFVYFSSPRCWIWIRFEGFGKYIYRGECSEYWIWIG